MITISSRQAKEVLAKHLAETCPEHLDFLKASAKMFGMDMTIELPENPLLRSKLEELRNAQK